MDFNLVASTFRHGEEEAKEELLDLLEEFGDRQSEVEITDIIGVLCASTSLDPFNVVEKLKELVSSEPWQVRYILRVIPVEEMAPSELDSIKKAAGKLAAAKMNENDSFRITVEKRHTSYRSMDIINAIAEEIKNKVDLEKPDWIVLIEIVGRIAGISVIRPEQIFSSIVEKRKEPTLK